MTSGEDKHVENHERCKIEQGPSGMRSEAVTRCHGYRVEWVGEGPTTGSKDIGWSCARSRRCGRSRSKTR